MCIPPIFSIIPQSLAIKISELKCLSSLRGPLVGVHHHNLQMGLFSDHIASRCDEWFRSNCEHVGHPSRSGQCTVTSVVQQAPPGTNHLTVQLLERYVGEIRTYKYLRVARRRLYQRFETMTVCIRHFYATIGVVLILPYSSWYCRLFQNNLLAASDELHIHLHPCTKG